MVSDFIVLFKPIASDGFCFTVLGGFLANTLVGYFSGGISFGFRTSGIGRSVFGFGCLTEGVNGVFVGVSLVHGTVTIGGCLTLYVCNLLSVGVLPVAGLTRLSEGPPPIEESGSGVYSLVHHHIPGRLGYCTQVSHGKP